MLHEREVPAASLSLKTETMAKKYSIKPGYENAEIVASKPPHHRTDGARFVLSRCTQKDLKYLHDVVLFKGVSVSSDEKAKTDEQDR